MRKVDNPEHATTTTKIMKQKRLISEGRNGRGNLEVTSFDPGRKMITKITEKP